MKRRVAFHFLNFFILAVIVVISTASYFYFSPHVFVEPMHEVVYYFIMRRWFNFALILVLTYFLIYLTGMVKYTIEDRHFKIANYFREIFKLVMILGMVSFVEFFVFFTTKIGRVIYLYIFAIYCIYYLSYLAARARKGPRKLHWLAAAPVQDIVKYIKPGAFHITETKEDDEVTPDPEISIVYQDGCITETTSEALIRNKLAGNTVIELVELIEKESGKIPVDYVNIHWFLEKFDVADRDFFRLSRSFNIIISIILLLVLFIPGFLVALVHTLLSRGPIFFTQQRIGLHGKAFRLIKFRSMVKDAEKNGARFAGRNDPRITPLGKVMRRLRIDEIPQLFNVLKGDMSMVGPRPERDVFIDSLSKELPYYKLRLLVPPGLTGWAQINGVYAGSDIKEHKEKLEYDLYYIKNRSIFIDSLIMLRTIKTILQARGE